MLEINVFPQVEEIEIKGNECNFAVGSRSLQACRSRSSQQHIPWLLDQEEWTFFVAS